MYLEATTRSGLTMSEQSRKLKNFIVDKPMQLRMSYYFVAVSLALTGSMLVFLNSYMNQIRANLLSVSHIPMDVQTQLDQQLSGMLLVAMGFLLLSVCFSIIYGIIIGHRYAGPMKVIVSTIEQIKKGEYDRKRELRPYDELIPIMESLNSLSEQLKKK